MTKNKRKKERRTKSEAKDRYHTMQAHEPIEKAIKAAYADTTSTIL
jgi:hypothetical protein